MPVYNAEKYLNEALDSIFAQTFSDFELICVDDGSSDSSVDILKGYSAQHKNINFVTQENKGAGAARNYGASLASGEYYIFLDADDFFESVFFEKMVSAITGMDADLCICEAKRYDVSQGEYLQNIRFNKPSIPETEPFSAAEMPDHIFNVFVAAPWNKMVSAYFYKENQLHFQEIMRANDVYFSFTALAMAKRICLLREPLVTYRVGMTTNAQATNVEHPFDFYYAFRAVQEKLSEIGLYSMFQKSFQNEALNHCIYNLNSQEGLREQETLFNKLKEEIIPYFELTEHEDDYYYSKASVNSLRAVVSGDISDYLRYRIGRLKNHNQTLIARCEKLKAKNEKLTKKYRKASSKLDALKQRKIYKLLTLLSGGKHGE